VCGGARAGDWAKDARARLAETKELSDKVRSATNLRDVNHHKLRGMTQAPPAMLERAADFGLPTDLLVQWSAWAAAPSDAAALCAHAEAKSLDLHAALQPFVAQAQQKLEAVESTWRPVARELASWLDAARAVEGEAGTLKALSAAEDWLKDAEAELRDKRFEPIATHAQAIWSQLRQQSSVDLAKIKLDGKGTKRHVNLNVSVDGHEGVALGVMSQGELNALALSLFLPRMMLAALRVQPADWVRRGDPDDVAGLIDNITLYVGRSLCRAEVA